MDRQLRIALNYKIYTLYGSNSGIPARTRSRWLSRKKKESTQLSAQSDEQKKDLAMINPPAAPPLIHNEDYNPGVSYGEISHASETGDSMGDSSSEETPEKSDTIIHNYPCDSSEDSEEEDMANTGMAANGADPTHNASPPVLYGYTTEDLVAPLLALAIKLRNGLSYTATEDCVSLAKVLTDARIRHSSKYEWKKISNSLCEFMSIHHFCDKCHIYVGQEVESQSEQNILSCPKCDEVIDMTSNWRSGNVILYLNLKDQIEYFLGMNHDRLIDPQNRLKENRYALEDIFDGYIYSKKVPKNTITLNFNVDGTPVHKSSLMSLYPILCTINEIPPKERAKNMILCSLWFGPGKPVHMNEFLKPFITELQSLDVYGIDYVYRGEKYHKNLRCLLGICDSVARPIVRNTSQFNHEYGCGLCLHPGIQVPKGKGTVKVYPIDDNENPFGEGLRTHDDTLIHAQNKEKGVKGRSVLYDVPGFNIIDGLPADWMHLATLGVAKQFCKLWLNSNNHSETFFLGQHEDVVNSMLGSFTPTLEISRTTRNIQDRKFWKAHEWSIWLLFYSLPILREIAPRKYVEHWALLVDGISILLKTSIMRSEVEYARQCLYDFIRGVENLYRIENVSFNVHLLAHLPDSVLKWGPLWTHSAFMYESFNFSLKNCVHSANGVPLQICDSFRYQISVLKLKNMCEEILTQPQRKFLAKMLYTRTQPKVTLRVNDVGLLGTVQQTVNLSRSYYLALRRLEIHAELASMVQTATRMLLNSEVIHSKLYKRPKKRKSYIVLTKEQEIFEIEIFVILSYDNSKQVYAIGKYYEKINSPFSNRRLTQLTFVHNQDRHLASINVQGIKEKVTFLHLQKQNISIACAHPNKYESWK